MTDTRKGMQENSSRAAEEATEDTKMSVAQEEVPESSDGVTDTVKETSDQKELCGKQSRPRRENVLMVRLRDALDKTVNRTLQSTRFSDFVKHFMDVNKQNPEALRCAHKHLISDLEGAIKNELEAMYTEENMESQLEALLKVRDSCPKDTQHRAWRPSGDPSLDVLAHTVPTKQKQKEKLTQLLADSQRRNAKLENKLMTARSRLGDIQQQAEQHVEQMSQIEAIPMDSISKYLEMYSRK